MILITIVVFVYLLSVVGMYFVTRYSYNNVYKSLSPGFEDIDTMFYPIVNTGIFICELLAIFINRYYHKKSQRKKRRFKISAKKFFRIRE